MKHALWMLLWMTMLLPPYHARGDNLIENGKFIAEQTDFPMFWHIGNGLEGISYHAAGGPKGMGYLSLQTCVQGKEVQVTQTGVTLCAGESYRLTGYFRTRGLRKSRFGVYNTHWAEEVRLIPPSDTHGQWTYLEEDVVMIKNDCPRYSIYIYLAPEDELMEVADLQLIPLSEKAKAESCSMLFSKNPVLTPLGILADISLQNPALECSWNGIPNPDLRVIYACPKNDMARTAKLTGNRVVLNLDPLKKGKHTVEVNVTDVRQKKTLFKTTLSISMTEDVQQKQERRLNNLVSQLYHQTMKANQSTMIPKAYDGWLYVRFAAEQKKGRLTFDGKDIIKPANTRGEAILFVHKGKHELKIIDADGLVTVRSIPEILNFPGFCPHYKGTISQSYDYDWDFVKNYMVGAVTTLNSFGGRPPLERLMTPEIQGEMRALGLHHVGNLNLTMGVEKMNAVSALPDWDGISVDEIFFDTGTMNTFDTMLKNYVCPPGKTVYTWVVGTPSVNCMDFISRAVNIPNGNGKLLCEMYLRGRPTEEKAKAYLKETATIYSSYRQYAPAFWGNMGMILGNFNLYPGISLNHYPETDYKCFLDMQVRMLATGKEFKGLRTVGFWGSNTEDEIVRWSFRLMRHYAIEGHTEPLASLYGFKFKPGILQDGDFIHKLKHWKASPEVQTGNHPGYGRIQGRWWCGKGVGDSFALLPNQGKLSQQLTGLIPGKLYTVNLIACDYHDLKAKQWHPRKLPVSMTMEKAVTIPEKCYYYVDDWKGWSGNNDKRPSTNMHRLVFRAANLKPTLCIKAGNLPQGTFIAVNNISVNPYFEEEMFQ